MTEIDVPVIGGPWVPAKDFLEKVQGAIDNSHGHENKSALDKIDDKFIEDASNAAKNNHSHENKDVLDEVTEEMIENNHSHANKEYLDTLSERPFITISGITTNYLYLISSFDSCISLFLISEEYEGHNLEGHKIKSLRFKINEKWFDVKDLTAYDGCSYVINMNTIINSDVSDMLHVITLYSSQMSEFISSLNNYQSYDFELEIYL